MKIKYLQYLLVLSTLAMLFPLVALAGNKDERSVGSVDATGTASRQVESSELKTVPLGDGIYMFSGDGGNVVAFVDDSETLVIDSGTESRVTELYQAIAQASHRPVTLLVNTSGNVEHAGGNAFFAAAGVTVVAQENAEKAQSSEDSSFASMQSGSDLVAGPLRSLYIDNMILHQGPENLRLVHYGPGDSDGNTVIYFDKANIVVVGDIFRNASYPPVDPASGGSVKGVIQTVDRVLAATNNKTRIIPGYGPIATRADLQAYRNMLITVSRRVRTLVSKGETKDQVLAAVPTKDFDTQWGTGDVRGDAFTSVLYGQIAARSKASPLSSAMAR